jgi:hypothetical protein
MRVPQYISMIFFISRRAILLYNKKLSIKSDLFELLLLLIFLYELIRFSTVMFKCRIESPLLSCYNKHMFVSFWLYALFIACSDDHIRLHRTGRYKLL